MKKFKEKEISSIDKIIGGSNQKIDFTKTEVSYDDGSVGLKFDIVWTQESKNDK